MVMPTCQQLLAHVQYSGRLCQRKYGPDGVCITAGEATGAAAGAAAGAGSTVAGAAEAGGAYSVHACQSVQRCSEVPE